ncbi:sialic acid-binding Ig-like lectin 14 isoform X2 [Pleuronectes platessa]|uniref:sialic acid-binding Ig-like lectin 14 isoform X2 n=1 Tax=Pleuronectes platessa TaxID=8262 RepID=UPI00232A5A83|nr:sialic acid-binding Ig-like lectin 14 isoform X2 [Pleuronectes platessa]
MFVFIWATLLFSLRVSDAETGSSVWGKQSCPLTDYCITLVEGEITAEAGLCVVIPCSFTVPEDIKVLHIVWFKCESTEGNCGDGDMIFNSNTFSDQVRSEFKGRVSLLESDVSKKNCSIIINDLKESDSGEYKHRVEALPVAGSGTFSQTANVSVQGLSQRPTVMIPPLTEGQLTTLTCTAPGLCSGSEPAFNWRWRGRGESDADLTGNITAIETENVTEFAKRRSSTLFFSPSAEHHGTNITCTVLFQGHVSTEETATLSVSYPPTEPILSMRSEVTEGQTITVSCTVESFPQSTLTLMRIDRNNQPLKITGNNLYSRPINSLSHKFTVTSVDAGWYFCRAQNTEGSKDSEQQELLVKWTFCRKDQHRVTRISE